MDADPHAPLRAIVKKLVFYVQLSARPESLAAEVAEIVCKDFRH